MTGSEDPPLKRPRPTLASGRLRLAAGALVVLPLLAVALYALASSGAGGGSSDSTRGRDDPKADGTRGLGRPAPPVRLPAVMGGRYNLSAFKGREPVLLFFQGGPSCASCWKQLRAISADASQFGALGIGSIVSIAVGPPELLAAKARDARITIPILADTDGKVTDAYRASGSTRRAKGARRSFVLVGRDGRILWRADDAAARGRSSFLPVRVLLTELRRPLKEAS